MSDFTKLSGPDLFAAMFGVGAIAAPTHGPSPFVPKGHEEVQRAAREPPLGPGIPACCGDEHVARAPAAEAAAPRAGRGVKTTRVELLALLVQANRLYSHYGLICGHPGDGYDNPRKLGGVDPGEVGTWIGQVRDALRAEEKAT